MNNASNEKTPDIKQLAAFNKAAGDNLRLEVLRVLAQNSYGVLELCEIFGYKQPGMSHHLKVLAEAGLVAKRREGNSIFYHRALPGTREGLRLLQQQLYDTIDAALLSNDVINRISEVQQKRVVLSQQFFVQQADRFKVQQGLIAEYPSYGEAVTSLLNKTVWSANTSVIEIGPGAGELLPILAQQFQHVTAVDNALTMLQQAESYCLQYDIDNIDFVHGSTKHLHTCPSTADCVVMNMVLHHISSPSDVFMDIATSLKPGGTFILTDLCLHDQEWAKTACGDVWLGFEPSELQHWALLAGLQQGHSNYLALRNGFQIQLQQFIKI